VGEIMVDGLGVGDVGNLVLNDRQKLADNGVMIVGVTVDTRTKQIIAGPDVQMRGLVYLKDADKLLKDVITTFESMVQEAMEKGELGREDVKGKIRDKLAFTIRRATGKDPIIMPMIVEV
jgi:ribonuclease J